MYLNREITVILVNTLTTMFVLNNTKKIFVALCLCIILFLYVMSTSILSMKTKLAELLTPATEIYCYQQEGPTLPNINEVMVRKGKTIFFHETSCRSTANGKITILPRQACAIESAIRMNPNLDVKVLFASPGVLKLEEDTESNRILSALMSYQNLQLLHVDYRNYTSGSPVEDLYNSGEIDRSLYAQSHASDVLRFLTLWKYGGIYLDLDVVVIKSLEDLPPNYSGSESDINVAAGVMSFGPDGIGHKMVLSCLNDLKLNFNGKGWGDNGPGVITRLLQFLCGVKLAKEMEQRSCSGFKVYPPSYFYPVPWQNWSMYFRESDVDKVFEMSKDSYVIHVWNKHSMTSAIPVTSNVPYILFAKKYCPKVFHECKQVF